jgi:hypothetical protein
VIIEGKLISRGSVEAIAFAFLSDLGGKGKKAMEGG